MEPLSPLVVLAGACRIYRVGRESVVALHPTTCAVAADSRIALVGPPGSGKSTLLKIMAGYDDPTIGTVTWPAIAPEMERPPESVAMICQAPALLPTMTVVENVALPLQLSGTTPAEAMRVATTALGLLELDDLRDRGSDEISAGEAQLVAVARALVGEPRLILADQPTEQLDATMGTKVIDILVAAADHCRAGLVVATQDLLVADRLRERWSMAAGRLERLRPAC
jgi:ABC-type lipoprotein export system ATPase subunit